MENKVEQAKEALKQMIALQFDPEFRAKRQEALRDERKAFFTGYGLYTFLGMFLLTLVGALGIYWFVDVHVPASTIIGLALFNATVLSVMVYRVTCVGP